MTYKVLSIPLYQYEKDLERSFERGLDLGKQEAMKDLSPILMEVKFITGTVESNTSPYYADFQVKMEDVSDKYRWHLKYMLEKSGIIEGNHTCGQYSDGVYRFVRHSSFFTGYRDET